MTFPAIEWAFRQEKIASSHHKFVLVALANYADRTGHAWPAISTICRRTGQDRKTVIAALARLQAAGLIEDTGKRVGKTKQIKVYRLKWATEQKEFQEQNSSAFPGKQFQKRPTEPSVEPLSLSLSKSEKCTLIQRAEAKRLFGQLSREVFGRELGDNQWPSDMEYRLGQALPMKREDWDLIDWFYRLPDHDEVFTMTYRRQSMAALLENLPREIEKIRSVKRRFGRNEAQKRDQAPSQPKAWTEERWAAFQSMFPDSDPGPWYLLDPDLRRQTDQKVKELAGSTNAASTDSRPTM